MRTLVFEGHTWKAYETLRENDKALHKSLRKILKQLLKDEDLSQGYGKPEKLKHSLAGLWSRRISQKDRLIYTFDEEAIHVFTIGGHYEDK